MGESCLTQSEYLLNLQLIDLTGPYLITFLIILLNVLGHFYITKKSQLNKNFYIIILSLLIVPLFGLYRINNIQTNEKFIEVVIIQPNIDPNKKWDYNLREKTMNPYIFFI